MVFPLPRSNSPETPLVRRSKYILRDLRPLVGSSGLELLPRRSERSARSIESWLLGEPHNWISNMSPFFHLLSFLSSLGRLISQFRKTFKTS